MEEIETLSEGVGWGNQHKRKETDLLGNEMYVPVPPTPDIVLPCCSLGSVSLI